MNRLASACLGLLCLMVSPATSFQLPEKPADMTDPTSHAEMVTLLEDLATRHDHVTLTEEGRSVEGKSLLMIRINPGDEPDPWRVLLIGVQHGDEPAGKEAILLLLRDIAENPELLAPGTELLALPMINPDGSDLDQRRNAAGRDLNRDHILITEPETLTMHRVVQHLRPHVIVDCHEYGRDAGRYTSRGWVRRADIMMGAMNSPHFNDDLVGKANEWVQDAASAYDGTDFTYREYYVGGPPPDFEQRYSTMTTSDVRNGLGSYDVLSFIIESARYTSLRDGYADFGDRIEAFYLLLEYLVNRTEDRSALRNILHDARTEELPPFVPVHYFWGNVGIRITDEIVREHETGADVVVPTANFQHDRIVKRTLPRPKAYAIPAEHAQPFLILLEKHGVDFQILSEPQTVTAEVTRRNARHPGLEYNDTTSSGWALELRPAGEVTLEAGSVLIPATHGTTGRKAALILEPTLVEGLYEAEPFGGLEDSEGNLPVLRIP